MQRAIPVTYYHSVGDHLSPRPKSFLTMPQRLFEQQIMRLLGRGFATIDLEQTFQYVCGKRTMRGPQIVLTFDDGFLDNWTHVFPLAKKMGFKFTVFVNPAFVDPRDIIRPTLEDVWAGKLTMEQVPWWGFLSWPEMRLMEKSGLVDIQSHTMTHTWYFDSPEVVDFHHPGDGYPWLIWNARPECMPFWLTELDETIVPYGTPVYRFKRSIAARQYFPDPQVDRRLQQFVADRGAEQFFSESNWRAILTQENRRCLEKYGDSGRFETDAEHQARIFDEVVDSRRIIEEKLNKEIRFLCWPGGAETPLARKIALENGYAATSKGTRLNRPGNDPSHIFRVASWFGSNKANPVKWWMFDGQMDRAQGLQTPAALAVGLLAKLRRIAVRKR